ncbi:MAG: hypothetical protein K2X39_01245 [Silvanigrellaceae bacterium]|nr:hypothetical protein [Silvanigrellaceae bacterium]
MIIYVISAIIFFILLIIYILKKINIEFFKFFKNNFLSSYFFDKYYFNKIYTYLKEDNIYLILSQEKDAFLEEMKAFKVNNNFDLKKIQINYKTTLYSYARAQSCSFIFLNSDNYYELDKFSYSFQKRLSKFFKKINSARSSVPLNGVVIAIGKNKVNPEEDGSSAVVSELIENDHKKNIEVSNFILREIQKYSNQSTPVFFGLVNYINSFYLTLESERPEFKNYKDMLFLINEFNINYQDFDDLYDKINLYIERKVDKITNSSISYNNCRNVIAFSHEIKSSIKNNFYNYFKEIYEESNMDIVIPFNGLLFFNTIDNSDTVNPLNITDTFKELSGYHIYNQLTVKNIFNNKLFRYNFMNYLLFFQIAIFFIAIILFAIKTYSFNNFVTTSFSKVKSLSKEFDGKNSYTLSIEQYKKNICKIFELSNVVTNYSFQYPIIYMSYFNNPKPYILNNYADKIGEVVIRSVSDSIYQLIEDFVSIDNENKNKIYTLSEINETLEKLSKISTIRSLISSNKDESYSQAIHMSLKLISGEMCQNYELVNTISQNINRKFLNLKFESAFNLYDEKAISKIIRMMNGFFNSYYSKNDIYLSTLALNSSIEKMYQTLSNSNVSNSELFNKVKKTYENFKNLKSFLNDDKYKWIVTKNLQNDESISFLQKKIISLNVVKDEHLIKVYFDNKFENFFKSLLNIKSDVFDSSILNYDEKKSLLIHKDIYDYVSNIGALSSYIDSVNLIKITEMDVSSNQRYSWNLTTLKDAYEKTSAMDKIISSVDKSNFTSEMNTSYNKYANFVLKVFWLDYLPTILESSSADSLFTKNIDISNAENNFFSSANMIKNVLFVLNKYQINSLLNNIYRILENNLENILLNSDQILKNSRVYEPVTPDFSSWDGESSPAFYAFGVANDDSLKLTLAKYRDTITDILNTKISPFLNTFYDVIPASSNFEPTSKIISSWVAIRKNLSENSSNSWLSILDDFILNKVNPLRFSGCLSFLDATKISPVTANFFSEKKERMLVALRSRCKSLYIEKAKLIYNVLVSNYTNNFKSMYPFSLSSLNNQKVEPNDLFNEFSQVNLFNDSFLPFLISKDNNSTFSEKQSEFIRSYKKLADIFNIKKDKEGQVTPIELTIAFDYRTNKSAEVLANQIIDWSLQVGNSTVGSRFDLATQKSIVWKYGDPIIFTLNLANSSIYKPLEQQDENISVNGYTVTYSYTSPWSLIEFLSKNSSCSLINCNDRLSFKIPLNEDKNITLFSDIKVFNKQKDKRFSLSDLKIKPFKWP